MKRTAAFLAAALLWVGTAQAVLPDEQLADPALEARARSISRELRCVVCQNQSIDDSDAPLARDLRLLVRARLRGGDTDDQVRQYLVDRYGTFVLLRPPVEGATWALWFGPAAVLLLGGLGVFAYLRRRREPAAADALPLDAADEARLAQLLDRQEHP